MDTNVSLLAAKALQSVDYNLPCDAFYDHPENHGQYLVERREWLDYNNGVWPRRISAPDILEAVLWLWENFGLWCEVSTLTAPNEVKATFGWMVFDRTKSLGCYVTQASEPDPITAYNSAIIAACEWVKTKKG